MWVWSFLCLVGWSVLCRGQVLKCDDFTDLDFHESFIGTNLNVKLLLYTRANLECGQEISQVNLLDLPLFQLDRPTAFVIHGYRPTGAPPIWLGHIVRLLAAQDDMNILLVDWNRGAANLNYFSAVANTRKAAENITAFILSMQENGADLSSIHMIGVSLGAHVAGFVGAMLKGKIGRITALDPAGPLFSGTSPEDRLDPTDAQFVDVLHTDSDAFGLREPLGHIDFYANGGADQPGCPKTIFSGKSLPCSSYYDFLDGRCLQCESFKPASCPILGYHVNQWRDSLLRLGQTKAFFSTTAESPYCKMSYKVDMVTWNQYTRWGMVIIKLHSGRRVVETRIDHKLSRFEQYTATRMLAQFDEDLTPVQKITICFVTGNVIGPRYKMRLLRIRFTPLEHPDRPQLCRYDMILEENMEMSFRPMACDESRI
ncbi:hypothetical protein AGOR_G00142190 [Albula goreensis]|uniref:Lipase domain-containing protein n=1 Tax=Albula goreensis TaxID=1534307 RepID=A0A8T3D0W6_9TELE|nr:hypothetical protein AGOR_G00142190 [Albula goreensis]